MRSQSTADRGAARTRRLPLGAWSKALYPGAAVAALALLAVGWVTPTLPAPSGAFPVGTITGVLPPAPTQGRSTAVTVQVWYPALIPSAGFGSTEHGKIAWRGIHIDRLYQTEAVAGAAAADRTGGFPVIVYVPDWGGARTGNTALAQQLASDGFAVVAMDPVNAPSEGMDFSSAEANAATLRLAERLVRAQARDAAALLDWMPAALGRSGVLESLAGRLDFQRVGILGFSFGGAVAAQACWQDSRFKAALDMDGWLFGDAAQDGIAQPLMVLSDDTPLPGPAELASARADTRFMAQLNLADSQRTAAIMQRFGGTRATIVGARHSNFSDLPLVWPVRRMVGAGPVPPAQAHRLVSAYANAFFGKHLNGEDAPLLRPGAAPLDGVRLERWPAPATP